MHPIENNLSLLAIMLDEVEAFLLSEEIFWPLTVKSKRDAGLPRLTLGAILLILDELQAQQVGMSPPQSIQYQKLNRQVERVWLKWAAAIERKANSESRARLNMWKAFIQDLEQSPEMILDYPQEVRNRVILSRLSEYQNKMNLMETTQILQHLDRIIWNSTSPGGFIWDEHLMPIYSPEKYPYLYRQPQAIE